MKDREIAALVNSLTHVAAVYHDSQQLRERMREALLAGINSTTEGKPVAWCELSLDGKHIAHFDGKPMVMVGPIGNDCHTTPLYTAAPQRKPLTDEEMYLAIRPLFKTDALASAALSISKDEYQAIEAAITKDQE